VNSAGRTPIDLTATDRIEKGQTEKGQTEKGRTEKGRMASEGNGNARGRKGIAPARIAEIVKSR
jgi:hypothetical protein